MGINGSYQYKSLLRFTTAGSVDDGKSTLIGRLLYDSKSIFEDQLENIARSSSQLGRNEIDLSLLTDGLRAEREQGITIDVAYRYFATPARKFIIADTPGHAQYTRNMVTGASTADLAVILTDARKGILEQTIRHSFIAALLDIRHVVFCINKMDMVGYSEEIFNQIRDDLDTLTRKLEIEDVHYIPISARYGDNVVGQSDNMKWYKGKTFLRLIETIKVRKNKDSGEARLPVQTVIRPHSAEYHDYRGYAGRISGGTFRQGDEVVVLPSMKETRIREINISGKRLTEGSTGDSVTLTLEDQLDAGRGDLIAGKGSLPTTGQEVRLMVCWFSEKPLRKGSRYIIRNCGNESVCIIKSIDYRININTLEKEEADLINMNDIAGVKIKTARPIYFDSYKKNNTTGSLIFIDEGTNETSGAGIIEQAEI